MSEFAKYKAMCDGGTAPEIVYQRAKADGLDEVSLIRLLRSVCGLSLSDAKRISGAAAAFDQKQDLSEGATVYWEGSDTVGGSYIMHAQISRVEGGRVWLTGHRKFLVGSDDLVEVPVSGGTESIPIGYFNKTLTERLGESIRFWNDLTQAFSHAG